MRRVSASSAATGASSVEAVAVNPGGGDGDGVEVAHPDVVDVGCVVRQQLGGLLAVQLGPAVLTAQAASDRATQLLGDQLGAVADAEDRHAEVVHGGSSCGAPGTWTLFGPPERISAAGSRAATSAAVMRLGTISE